VTTMRLKFAASVNPRPDQVDLAAECTFLPMEAIGERGGADLSATRIVGEVKTGYTPFRDGDVLFAKITPCFENAKGTIVGGLRNGIGYGTTELHVLRSRAGRSDPRWLFYVTQSHLFMKLGEAEMYGAGGQKRVPPSFVENFTIDVPAIDEQRAIADFLDEKTAAIDALIARKERLLALLEEKRQALITQAVTKGLDPSVPMKESGVEWLGSIPFHWTVARVKHRVSQIVDCPHSTPVYEPDGTFPAIRTADVDRGRLLLHRANRVSEETYLERTARLVPVAGDVLYSREGERFGMAALVPRDVRLCLAQRMMMFRVSSETDAKYLMWTLNATNTYEQVRQDTIGATAPRINIPTIANAWIAVPPLAEQQDIGARIEASLAEGDRLFEKCRESIERLIEYRQAVVTAAVTGHLDVRSKQAGVMEPAA
jgi:type I restriction enzyme S subunit